MQRNLIHATSYVALFGLRLIKSFLSPCRTFPAVQHSINNNVAIFLCVINGKWKSPGQHSMVVVEKFGVYLVIDDQRINIGKQ